MNILIFSIGAAIGAPLRFWLDNKFRPQFKFPLGIFIANIAGSFVIGLVAHNLNFLVLGFCGALTTWSTFIVDVYLGIANKQLKQSLINLLGSLILGVLAFKFGISLRSA